MMLVTRTPTTVVGDAYLLERTVKQKLYTLVLLVWLHVVMLDKEHLWFR